MANVLFKRGLHSALPTGSNIKDGVFYLTTDTSRLYIGQQLTEQDTPKLIELNKSITVVSNVNQLPTNTSITNLDVKGNEVAVGQFYYVNAGANSVSGNILAVCAAINSETGAITWVQVNPDTNDNDHLGDVTIGSASESNGTISVPITFQMVNKNGTNITGVGQKTLTFSASDIIKSVDADVDVSAVTNGVVTVTTKIKDGTKSSNNLSTGDSFALKAGSGVTINKNANDQIEISADVTAGAVALDVDGSETNLVTATVQVNGVDSGETLSIAGEKGIAVTYDSTNDVAKLGHTNTVTNGTNGGATETATTLANGGNFTAVIESKYDEYGHVTSQKKQTITLPTISASSIGVDATDKSKLTFAVKDQNGTETAAATSDSILYHTITVYDSPTGTASAVTKKNQSDLGTFYSKAAIDAMMQSLDALTYKGTVASASAVNALTNVSNGDTYKASADFTYNGTPVKTGDLLIATGTENSSGIIAEPTWTIVSSGAEADTTYKTKVTDGTANNSANVGIIASTAAGNFTQYTTISGDSKITVSATEGEDSAGALALGHASSGVTAGTYGAAATDSGAASGSIHVPSITVDATGHVTAASTKEITLPGDDKLAGDATNKKVELQNANGTALGSITFANGTLTTAAVAANGVNETVTISHAVPSGYAAGTTATASKDISSATDADRQIVGISGITRDSYGHVTGVTTTTYTLGQINDKLVSSITAGTNAVTVSSDLQTQAGASKGTTQFTLQSPNNTIAISNPASSTNINIDIEWGSF